MRDAPPIRALIVDDEPLAREIVREMLRRDPEMEVVAEAANGLEALAAIEEHAPDIVFLDVQMPEMDGFGVLEAVSRDRLPAVIFVTAYDQYAVRAFEVHAFDYILKPFDWERFEDALGRAKAQIRRDDGLGQKLDALLQEMKRRPGHVERLIIKTNGRVIFLRTEEIDWIEAEGNYVRLHVGKDSFLQRETISGLEARLDGREFPRIHRSTIVNIDRVQELRPWFQGDYCVILRDGTQLPLSRNYWEKLKQLLGGRM
ncbi:MAG TPA: LytTR family DNA-binding domain-containing protein [Blastocatellia bacterium]|jgi:two-component system LytT family response regulator|nr:LytTR family DNA-binding domain-containing protein [Blastocatellia bacterium]